MSMLGRTLPNSPRIPYLLGRTLSNSPRIPYLGPISTSRDNEGVVRRDRTVADSVSMAYESGVFVPCSGIPQLQCAIPTGRDHEGTIWAKHTDIYFSFVAKQPRPYAP